MTTIPRIENRPERLYVGKRVVTSMSALKTAVPNVTAEVAKWLMDNGEQAAGGSLVRYRLIDMPKKLEVEVGLTVSHAPAANGEMEHGLLPAGRYATLTFKGIKNAVGANASLMDWIEAQGELTDSEQTNAGHAFVSRVETLLTDPQAETDQDQWETEIAIKLRD